MPHKFKIGVVVHYSPKDRMLSTARGTYTTTGARPGARKRDPARRLAAARRSVDTMPRG